MVVSNLLLGLLRRAGSVLGLGGSLVALVVVVCVLGFACHNLMEATDYLGMDPERDRMYLDGAQASVQDLSDFPADQRRLTNSLDMELVLIPAGEFVMGSPRWEAGRKADELPHRVRITRPFYMAACEVTVAQFRRFVEETGFRTDAEISPARAIVFGPHPLGANGPALEKCSWRNAPFDQGDDSPVVLVSWRDAVAFCQWLSRKEGREYRLPTEAEWEYSCRGGTVGRFWSGEEQRTLRRIGNFRSSNVCDPHWESWDDGHPFTSPCGTFASNPFGLFDVHGNVREWCADWYGDDYYRRSPSRDPEGPSEGEFRVLRGGSFDLYPASARSANRASCLPGCALFDVGFRVAMSVSRS
jgi:formylglycine-generating enzyme required for sulfatase activity